MNSLPEQFSAARQAQLDNGFNLMRSFSDQALDRTSRVLSLQLDASRTAVEQSSNALRQLLAARDPRDLLELGTQSQQQLRTMLDYSRELFSIATAGMSLPMLGAPAAGTPAQAATQQAAAQAVEQIHAATQAQAQAAPRAEFALPTEVEAEAEASIVTSNIEPHSAPTAMAKATSEALDLPIAPPHPVAASMPVDVAVEIELPKVEPVDATPPPAAVTGRPAETRGTKGRRGKQG